MNSIHTEVREILQINHLDWLFNYFWNISVMLLCHLDHFCQCFQNNCAFHWQSICQPRSCWGSEGRQDGIKKRFQCFGLFSINWSLSLEISSDIASAAAQWVFQDVHPSLWSLLSVVTELQNWNWSVDYLVPGFWLADELMQINYL